MSGLHSSPHLQSSNSISRIMFTVMLALLPGMLAYVYFLGPGLIINMLLAIVTAVAVEALVLQLRQRLVMVSLMDGSAILTAMLLALSIPPLVPWWIPVLGTAFAMLFAKHLYGGLGYNPFNPAMVGFAMLLISFPREMTAWLSVGNELLSVMDFLRYSFTSQLPDNLNIDALSMASPLDSVKSLLHTGVPLTEITRQQTTLFGQFAGKGWEWINLAFLAGGLLLLLRRIISWQIPVAMLLAMALLAGIFHLINPEQYASPLFHLLSGATMLGAFFIATDPVTASTTPRGRLYYAAGIGILVYVIRNWGGYPDAVAFAVLLMNMAVPTIDYYTRPRVFGEQR